MNQYFAALPDKECVAECQKKIDHFRTAICSTGHYVRLRSLYRAYYGFADDGTHMASGIYEAGESGEMVITKVNEFRSHVQNALVMITKDRPEMTPRAKSTDANAQAACKIAANILDNYWRDMQVGKQLTKCAEVSIVLQEGFVEDPWDTEQGRVIDQKDEAGNPVEDGTGIPVREGDVGFHVHTPFTVIRDIDVRDWKDNNWILTSRLVNKWDAAARFRQSPDTIKMAEHIEGMDYSERTAGFKDFIHVGERSDDLAELFTLYHKKTPSVPGGRVIKFFDAESITLSAQLPEGYSDIPVRRMAPADVIGTQFGYSFTADLLGMQDALDAILSAEISNHKNLGLPTTWSKKGDTVVPSDLGSSHHVESDTKPEVLQLYVANGGAVNLFQLIRGQMGLVSGINEVARGNPEGMLKGASGSALALLASQAVQYMSGLQGSYIQLNEDVGTDILKQIFAFSTTERSIAMAGKNNQSYLTLVDPKKLEMIDRVVAEVANPVSKTTAWKLEMAKDMLANGFVKNPQQYVTVMTTGKLEPMYEGEQRQNILIKMENEEMQAGQPVQAMASDDHPSHMIEHNSLLSDPVSRKNPQIVQNVNAHVMEHFQLMQNTDPQFLMLFGIKPLPSMGPAEGAAPTPGPGVPPSMEAQQPNMPQMPVNPATGERSPQ